MDSEWSLFRIESGELEVSHGVAFPRSTVAITRKGLWWCVFVGRADPLAMAAIWVYSLCTLRLAGLKLGIASQKDWLDLGVIDKPEP